MPESAVEEIRIKLETHLNEIEAEIESLRSTLSSMDAKAEAAAAAAAAAATSTDAPTAETRRPSRRRAATNGARRNGKPTNGARKNGKPTNGARSNGKPTNGTAPVRRSPKASAELERLLAETGGMTAVELARQTGTDYGEVLERIRELERAASR